MANLASDIIIGELFGQNEDPKGRSEEEETLEKDHHSEGEGEQGNEHATSPAR